MDLHIRYQDKLYVIEFKFAHYETCFNANLNEAIAQTQYIKYIKLLKHQKMILLAMVILEKSKRYKGSIHEIAKILEIKN